MPEEVKSAVREKWLTYCKCQHNNQVMLWRKELHTLKEGSYSLARLKLKLAYARNSEEKFQLDFVDGVKPTKKYEKLGERI